MELITVDGVLTTSGHNAALMVDLPEEVKGKGIYFIKGNFVQTNITVSDVVITKMLCDYEENRLTDDTLAKKSNVLTCVGKNNGKMFTDGRYIHIQYNAEKEQHKVGYTAILGVN
jgi:hypothetical protein